MEPAVFSTARDLDIMPPALDEETVDHIIVNFAAFTVTGTNMFLIRGKLGDEGSKLEVPGDGSVYDFG